MHHNTSLRIFRIILLSIAAFTSGADFSIGIRGGYDLYRNADSKIEHYPASLLAAGQYLLTERLSLRIETGFLHMNGLSKGYVLESTILPEGRIVLTGKKLHAHIDSRNLPLGLSLLYRITTSPLATTVYAGEGIEFPLYKRSSFDGSDVVNTWQMGDNTPYPGNDLYATIGCSTNRIYGNWQIGLSADVRMYHAVIGSDEGKNNDWSSTFFHETFDMIKRGIPVFSLHVDVLWNAR